MSHKTEKYHSQILADFVRQLLFTPKSRRPEQIVKTEALHDLITPNQNYPFDFINYHITGYHSESEDIDSATILVGQAILSDLRWIIDELCESAETMPDNEAVTDLATLAKELNVSTKTIHRWRDIGLRWRRYRHPEYKRFVLGFTASALEHFDKTHPGKLKQAAAHDQMSAEQLNALLDQAKELARQNPTMSLNHVAQILASASGRALQTLRVQLEKHDRQHPESPIFPTHHGPLTHRQARQIAKLKQRGASSEELCKRFGKTPSTIRRAVLNACLEVMQRVKIKPIHEHASYIDPNQIVVYRNTKIQSNDWLQATTTMTEALPHALILWFAQGQLKPNSQLKLFRQYHFLRFTADQSCQALKPNTCTATQVKQLEDDLRHAGKLRDILTTSSLPIVMSVARKHLDHVDAHSIYILQDMLILGCQILYAELDQFDPHRKQTFDTYLTWRLQKCYATWLSDPRRASLATRRMRPEQAIKRIRIQATHFGIRLPDLPLDQLP